MKSLILGWHYLPLKHYVELLFKHLKTNSRPNYGAIPSRTNERWVPEADVQKIKNSLSWEPRINIEEGIIKTVNWYKNNKHLYLIPKNRVLKEVD